MFDDVMNPGVIIVCYFIVCFVFFCLSNSQK